MKHSDGHKGRARLVLLAAALALGLIMPFAAARVQDALGARAWPLEGEDAHYVYAGTLRNRALALSSYRNGARTVEAEAAAAEQPAPDCWRALAEAGLLPPGPDALKGEAHALALAPAGCAARYEYLGVEQRAGNARLSATVDAQTGLCLVAEARMEAEELRAWLGDTPLMELLRRFAAYWGCGEVSETLSSLSNQTGYRSQSAAVTGTYYNLTVMTMPDKGLIMYVFSAQ